jgi:hypothetical protein
MVRTMYLTNLMVYRLHYSYSLTNVPCRESSGLLQEALSSSPVCGTKGIAHVTKNRTSGRKLMMKSKNKGTTKWALYATGLALLLGGATTLYAYSSYLTQFNTTYGTAGTALASCGVCHIATGGGGPLTGYGTDFLNNGTNFAAIESLDSDKDGFSNIAEITARTNPGDSGSHPAAADTTPPSVNAFTVPATSSSLTVSITAFTATDTVGVTGYLVTETAASPASTAAGWSATPQKTYTFATAGSKTLYAWAKDGAGNVSASRTASVAVTLPDTTAPTVTQLVIPSTSSSLTVPINTLTATDAGGVAGYFVSETATKPLAGAAGWSAGAPANYTFSSAGTRTLYAWAKDGAGNVSASLSANVTIALPDTTAPTITGFNLPATSSSLTVPINTLTASDNIAVTGYLLSESSATPLPSATGWLVTAPGAYTFASAGSKTLHAWAKDGAGNISAGATATVGITVSDTSPPVVTNFVIPVSSTSLNVSVTTFTGSDNVGVTGYLLTETSATPLASATGWSATKPTGYNFLSAGTKTLYAWVKDAAGNVSAAMNSTVTISLSDSTPPTVTSFVIPSTSSSLSVSVSNLVATDNVAVTGYLLTETSATPPATTTGWSQNAPGNYSFASAGTKTLYAWAKDAAGNVSQGAPAGVTIALLTPPPSTGSISTYPKRLSFSEVEVSESQTKTLRITNAGSTSVVISAIRIDSDDFTARFSRPLTVRAHGALTLRVAFTPNNGGTSNGTLSIFLNNQESASVMVSLKGTGVTDEGESDYRDSRDR